MRTAVITFLLIIDLMVMQRCSMKHARQVQ